MKSLNELLNRDDFDILDYVSLVIRLFLVPFSISKYPVEALRKLTGRIFFLYLIYGGLFLFFDFPFYAYYNVLYPAILTLVFTYIEILYTRTMIALSEDMIHNE